MSGKAWTFTLLTSVSFFTIYIHHAKSECMLPDLQSHLHDELLDDHLFEMKEFLNSKEQHKVLSVINTLCSTWKKNMNKSVEKFPVIKTIQIMLEHLFNNVEEMNPQKFKQECDKYNCTDGYHTTYMDVHSFGKMYSENCDTSLSGLECPSEKRTTSSTSKSPALTASERTTSSKPEISQNNTAHEYWSTASSTTTVPQFTFETYQGYLADTSIKVLLDASVLLNVLLIFWLWNMNNRKNRQIQKQS
ncbi:hypothetical protein E1301_Tti023892 [Triplophysa tibetana]|uniref:Uncharacterized protein n=1 Tax=Triplophysa tibetana TaxID=1572043 RepID=A0A5A9MWL1_9TELE|nr:hypothetical protein E1301_Tti023892 [Triplophysa tibetana]